MRMWEKKIEKKNGVERWKWHGCFGKRIGRNHVMKWTWREKGARFNINRSKKQLVVVKRGGKRPNLREITVLEEEKRNNTVVN